MFNYFGSKSKILHLYPKPQYNTIIEPFCGSARYACLYGVERDVWINDIYKDIYQVWRYIQQASPSDIRSLPEPKKGESLSNYKQLSKAERKLLGFCTSGGAARPGKTITQFAHDSMHFIHLKQNLLKLVGKISHWKITCLDYMKIPNQKATWYVDPPYQHQGDHYKFNGSRIDFPRLGRWCKRRDGQVIVCEGENADWLPFRVLREYVRIRKLEGEPGNGLHYREMIWTKSDKLTKLEKLLGQKIGD